MRVTPAAQVDHDNPWPGLESYDESSYGFFSGRTTETDELLRRILDEPVTVLFGKSGLGKTSLLTAGVFPRLREKDLLPIFIRLQVRTGSEPLIGQVRRVLLDELDAHGIEHGELPQDETLWESLHRSGLEFWTRQNRLVRPLFVFDQFEELFTLGAAVPADVAAFREALADLAENRIPATLEPRLELHTASELRLDIQAMPYKVVIALREDFLADLEGWRLTMPSLRRNRMRLLPMGTAQALEAVCNPRTSHLVSERIGQRIVAFLSSGPDTGDTAPGGELSGAAVEPALLSLFCRGVNEHRKRDRKTTFDDALLEGGKDTIVADFYESSLADQPERVRRFIEEDLITEHGFRNSYSVEDAVGRKVVTVGELDTLINRHLLRHEHHLGAERIELTHDLLTNAVVEERNERRLTERGERERQARWKKLRAGAIAVALLIVPVFASLAFFAWRAEQRANTESSLSRSRELAAIAGSRTVADPELAIALAIEGLNRADTAEARAALLDAARYVWPSSLLHETDLGGAPDAVALSADGDRLAVLAGQTITMWDVTTRAPRPVWEKPAVLAGSSSIAFSPDQKVLVVARVTSITVLDASSGQARPEIPLAKTEVPESAIAFSRDGRWLGWTQNSEQVALLDFEHPSDPPVVVDVGPNIGFALPESGSTIVTVTDHPLRSEVLTRVTDKQWTHEPFDLTGCTSPQSISPGTRLLSATWKGRRCTYRFGRVGVLDRRNLDRDTWDIIWSAGGGASAELLYSGEFIVSGADNAEELENHVRAEHKIEDRSDKTLLISVSESGRRFAFIDADKHKLVKIFSLGGHKPFLSGFDPNGFAVAPDGAWFAATSVGPGATAGVDITPIDRAFESNYMPHARVHINLDRPPARLQASADSLVVVHDSRTVVYDVETGQPRFPPLDGDAQAMGETGELLLLEPSSTQPWRMVKTRDGSQVASWERARVSAVIASSTGGAIAAVPVREEGRPPANAVVYSIAGTTLTPARELADLLEIPDERQELTLSDDGLAILDDGGQRTYGMRDATQVRSTAPPQALPQPLPAGSPTGGFEIEYQSGDATTEPTMTLVKRAGNVTVKRFASMMTYRFSADDKWLAVWGNQGLQILELATGRTTLTLNQAGVKKVRFVGGNSILSVQLARETMLVPLDFDLMKRFATWLTPRDLSSREKCLYGLAAQDCR